MLCYCQRQAPPPQDHCRMAAFKLHPQEKQFQSSEGLADIKGSNPVEVAQYAVTRQLDHEPLFVWWVPQTLKRRDHIIVAANKWYLRRTHKFGSIKY